MTHHQQIFKELCFMDKPNYRVVQNFSLII